MSEDFENQHLSILLAHPVLAPEREFALLLSAKKGDQSARNELVRHNQRLVCSIARRYTGHGLSLMELIQEGNIGLMHAIEKFELESGNRLSTYASYWIRQAVSRAVEDQTRTIRIPNRRQLQYRQVLKARQKLNGKSGHKPTDEEMAAECGLEPQEIARLECWHKEPFNLDEPLSDAEDANLFGDFIKDERPDDAETLAEQADLAGRMEVILENLRPRERKVIEMRYGINGHGSKAHTLQEVADHFGLTRERIGQIEAAALKRLRHPRTTRKLRGYL